MNTDTHFYDQYIHDNFQTLIQHLPEISNEQEHQLWIHLIQYPKDHYIQHGIVLMYQQDCIDTNVNYRPKRLIARLWNQIHKNPDLIEQYFYQVKDMLDTHGTCPQGRTNRCIQIIQCLHT